MRTTSILLLLVPFLSGCANQGKIRQQELARIGDWLPGQYSQVIEPTKMQPARELTIAPIFAPFIGELVLYAHTSEIGSPRHVLAQQVYRFETSQDEKAVVHRTFEFKEPQRWAGGLAHPEIFRGLLAQDVSAVGACDLSWTFDGERFEGVAKRKACPIRQMSFDGVELKIEQAGNPAGQPLLFRRIEASE